MAWRGLSKSEGRSTRISVCIPVRNQAGFVGEAIASVYRSNSGALELVICDDASDDDTYEVARSWALRAPHNVSVVLHRNERPLGMFGNFAHSISLSQGEYVCKVDGDDRLLPHYLATLAALLDRHPNAGWAHCACEKIDVAGNRVGLFRLVSAEGFTCAEDGWRQYLHGTRTVNIVLIRRSAYESVGGYDPAVASAGDWLLWLELLAAGHGYAYCATPLAQYTVDSGSKAKRMLQRSEAYRYMLAKMGAKWPAFDRGGRDKGLRLLAQAMARNLLSPTMGMRAEDRRTLARGALQLDGGLPCFVRGMTLVYVPLGLHIRMCRMRDKAKELAKERFVALRSLAAPFRRDMREIRD